MADSVPCQLAGSYQTVNRTDVNEYAVVLDGANLALELLANLNGLPELSSLSVANLSCSLADRADYSVALLVDLDNLELNGLLNQVLKLAASRNASLGSRDKYSGAVSYDDHAALDCLCNYTLKSFVRFLACSDLLHAQCGINALLGQENNALRIVYLCYDSVDLVADLNDVLNLCVGVVGQLVEGYVTRVLCAQLYYSLVRLYANNCCLDFGAGI